MSCFSIILSLKILSGVALLYCLNTYWKHMSYNDKVSAKPYLYISIVLIVIMTILLLIGWYCIEFNL